MRGEPSPWDSKNQNFHPPAWPLPGKIGHDQPHVKDNCSMLIRIGFDLTFEIPAPVPMVLMLYTHPSRTSSLFAPEYIHSSPSIPISTFIDHYGNRCGRIVAPAGVLRLWHQTVV